MYGLPVSDVFRFGQEAVILFFLLSGFVIGHSTSRKPFNALAYLRARFLRIFIPLFPALALSFLAQAVIRGRFPSPDLRSLMGNIFMTQDLTSLPGTWTAPYMGNNPLWSLSYEWWFYVAFLLLMKFVKSWNTRTVIVTGLAILASVLYPIWPDWGLRVVFSMAIWWTGVLAAKAWSEKLLDGWRGLLPGVPLAAVTVALALSVGIVQGFGSHSLGDSPIVEIRRMAAGIVIFLAAQGWRRIGWRGFDQIALALAWAAPISYGLYIVHRPILSIGWHFRNYIGTAPAIALAIALSFVLAWVIERCIYVKIESLVPKVRTGPPPPPVAWGGQP